MNDERLGGLELGNNIETLFKVEPPLTVAPSNYGYIGVLLRNRETDKIQCHICGEWFKSVGSHSARKHKINSYEYRKTFSLPLCFPLCSRKLSGRKSEIILERMANGYKPGFKNRKKFYKKQKYNTFYGTNTEAYKNKRGLCNAQIDSRYLILCEELGKELSSHDLFKYDPALLDIIVVRYGKFSNFKKEKGYVPCNMNTQTRYTDEKLIGILRNFYIKNGKIPRVKHDIEHPSNKTFYAHFGSWSRALQAAGFIKKKD